MKSDQSYTYSIFIEQIFVKECKIEPNWHILVHTLFFNSVKNPPSPFLRCLVILFCIFYIVKERTRKRKIEIILLTLLRVSDLACFK